MKGIQYCYLSCKLKKCNFLIAGDVPRVNGQLAVFQDFRDKSLKTHLHLDPNVKEWDVDSEKQFLILSSDGLWKVGILNSFWYYIKSFKYFFCSHLNFYGTQVMDNHKAANFVSKIKDSQIAAK